ncbi:MAG: GAF domain-containing protein [Deltaproteobacteria bacterium]|nr:GAF domain-containing protein [Deltaproteobacteria bacterium]
MSSPKPAQAVAAPSCPAAARCLAADPLGTLRLRGQRGGASGADLQGILDAFPFYVILVDGEHRILCANAAVQESLGVDPCAIVGGHCAQVVHGTDEPYPGCPLEQALCADGAVECDIVDHERHRVLRSGLYPTRYETAGGLPVFLHTARDVTDQCRAEERVRRGLDAQRLVNAVLKLSLEPLPLPTILQGVTDYVVTIPWLCSEPRGAIFLVDEQSGELVMAAQRGIEPALLKACARLRPGECVCGRAAATGQAQFARSDDLIHERVVEGMAPHGHYCLPIRDGGAVLGVLSACVDAGHQRDEGELDFLVAVADVLAGVIERKRGDARQLDHERIARSRERMARVGELSAGVAHTVRNPLHGVLNCVDIIEAQAKRGEPVSGEILSLMRDGLGRIEKVTRRLLALTRGGAPERRPTPVGTLLDDVLDLMSVQASKRGIVLRREAGFTGEARLSADRVVEGLSAVVSNAIDASQAGDTIVVRSRLEAGPEPALVLEIEDHGCGIPPEHLPRVLDPFFTTKPIGEGSGLGLAIARRVMDEHDGEIEIASQPGQGTLVRLVFRPPVVTAPGAVAAAAP